MTDGADDGEEVFVCYSRQRLASMSAIGLRLPNGIIFGSGIGFTPSELRARALKGACPARGGRLEVIPKKFT